MTDAVSINNPINYMATVGNIISGGNIVAASGNASISTTTGALVVVGGAGISGNLNVGSTITTPTMPPGTANTAVATTAFVQVNGSPTGGLMMWPTASPPTGWLLCNGQAISRATYAALFAILGTTFGAGDNSTTFNLPNYTNRVPVGAGGLYSSAATGGSKDAVVVAHTHSINDSGHVHFPPNGYNWVSDTFSGDGTIDSSRVTGPDEKNMSDIASTSAVTGISIQSSGVSGTDANMPPYLAIYYIIKA
jgi:microcystin-dependent protein